jgi:DNA invertase Pin-like site-specific DNA recombinase
MQNVIDPIRVAIFVTTNDHQLAANQRARMERYADAMGWTVARCVEADDQSGLLAAAAIHAFDRVLCWRTSEVGRADVLLGALARHGIELLAVAQSCAAMPE